MQNNDNNDNKVIAQNRNDKKMQNQMTKKKAAQMTKQKIQQPSEFAGKMFIIFICVPIHVL